MGECRGGGRDRSEEDVVLLMGERKDEDEARKPFNLELGRGYDVE
jgi:hypothetical protein